MSLLFFHWYQAALFHEKCSGSGNIAGTHMREPMTSVGQGSTPERSLKSAIFNNSQRLRLSSPSGRNHKGNSKDAGRKGGKSVCMWRQWGEGLNGTADRAVDKLKKSDRA